jgi:Spy/CpxP family protein refolding chaperone
MSIRNFLIGSVVMSLLLSSSGLFAQGQWQKKTPEERAENQTHWMQKNLNLNNDQARKVHDIILKYASQAEDAPRGQRQTIMANKDADLKSVLSADQFQQYQAHEQQMKERMQQRRPDMPQNGN